ncbi:MAG: hypothetical protein HC798_00890, partial [Polaribacter sp.]|nr:hypothetical protein [Polaribacter sp.]
MSFFEEESPLISVEELNEILNDNNVIIFNCTIPKVSTVQSDDLEENLQI